MADNYEKIAASNLQRLYANLPDSLEKNLPAEKDGQNFKFKAFGQTCVISPEGITLDQKPCPSILAILISLYALYANPEPMIALPFRAFKQWPGSMPYVGAFTTHTEQILAPHTANIYSNRSLITTALSGENAPDDISGDFAFVIRPLPKIALCYIFYQEDEDFPASVTCLFSQNADRFLPTDGLADTGEYTSRKILELIEK
jgi:hypothetical protein